MWPQFSQVAAFVGFASVHALPMRLGNNVLGTLGLFGDRVGRLEDDDLALAQALVHVATVAIVNEKSAADHATVNAQLQHALTSRILLEQAKGVLAHIGGLTMEEAFTALRQYARDHGAELSDVAAQVVTANSLVTCLLSTPGRPPSFPDRLHHSPAWSPGRAATGDVGEGSARQQAGSGLGKVRA